MFYFIQDLLINKYITTAAIIYNTFICNPAAAVLFLIF